MKLIRINIPGIIFMVAILTGCNHSKGISGDIFTPAELTTLDEIINWYDEFVLSETANELNVPDAYREYLSNIHQGLQSGNELEMYLPSWNERMQFYQSLDKGALSEIFDTLSAAPYQSINVRGRYMELLKELAGVDDFFQDYLVSMETAGDIAPANYSMILSPDNQMDFTRKEHRLVFIINLLKTGPTLESIN